MQAFFGFLYITLFFAVVVASLFIVFHLSRYSINRRLAFGMMLLFLTVTGVLLWSNTVLFLTLPFGDLLPATMNSSL
jgi:hypothetical protein